MRRALAILGLGLLAGAAGAAEPLPEQQEAPSLEPSPSRRPPAPPKTQSAERPPWAARRWCPPHLRETGKGAAPLDASPMVCEIAKVSSQFTIVRATLAAGGQLVNVERSVSLKEIVQADFDLVAVVSQEVSAEVKIAAGVARQKHAGRLRRQGVQERRARRGW